MTGHPCLVPCALRSALGAALIALACAPAAAQNWFGLMKDTPAQYFDDDDVRLFLDAGRKALNDTPLGGGVKWENPTSGSRGEVEVAKEFTWKDHPCRQLRIYSQSGGRRNTTNPNLCKVDGKWRAVSPTELGR